MSSGSFIGGRFEHVAEGNSDGVIMDIDPGDLTAGVERFPYRFSHVDDAIESARKAFGAWGPLPLKTRIEALKRYQAQIASQRDELAKAITHDVGKPLWESYQEVSSMVSKVDVTIK